MYNIIGIHVKWLAKNHTLLLFGHELIKTSPFITRMRMTLCLNLELGSTFFLINRSIISWFWYFFYNQNECYPKCTKLSVTLRNWWCLKGLDSGPLEAYQYYCVSKSSELGYYFVCSSLKVLQKKWIRTCARQRQLQPLSVKERSRTQYLVGIFEMFHKYGASRKKPIMGYI